MEMVQILRDRMMMLAGQFEEAKRIYAAALKESEGQRADKKQDKESTTIAPGNTAVCNTVPNTEPK